MFWESGNTHTQKLKIYRRIHRYRVMFYIDIHKFVPKKGVNWNNTSREFGSFTLEGRPTVDTDNGNRVYTINRVIGVCE